jgi:hypothetical protein
MMTKRLLIFSLDQVQKIRPRKKMVYAGMVRRLVVKVQKPTLLRMRVR